MIIIFFVLFIVILFYFPQNEHFIDFHNINNYHLDKMVDDNIYLNFLENLDNNSIKTKIGPYKTVSIENQKKALDKSFKSINVDENSIDLTILTDNTPILYKNTSDHCDIKATKLCEHTNPYQFLVNTKNVAPFRKNNDNLAKETDLHCWTSMYNCCKNNF